MLPIPISRNMLLALLSALVIGLLFVLGAEFIFDIERSYFIPNSANWLNGFDQSFPRSSIVLSMLMILMTGYVWNNRMVNSEILLKEDFSQLYNFVLVGGLVYFCLPSLVFFLSMFFLSLAMERIFRVNKNTDTAYSICFDSGLFLGIAVYFNFSLIIFLFFIWISMIVLKSLGFKEFIWSLIGYIGPFLFVFFVRFLFNLELIVFPESFFPELNFEWLKDGKLLSFFGLSFVAIFFGYLALNKHLNKSSVRYKQTINALIIFFIFFLVFTALVVGLNGFYSMSIFFLFIVPFFWHCISCANERYIFSSGLYFVWTFMLLYALI